MLPQGKVRTAVVDARRRIVVERSRVGIGSVHCPGFLDDGKYSSHSCELRNSQLLR
jgi:hypothetical protein